MIWRGALLALAVGLAGCHRPHGLPGSEGAVGDFVIAGREIYASACATCHLDNGAGVPGLNPPLRGSATVQGPVAPLAALMLHGLRGPLEVAGTTYRGVMPAWKDTLIDPQLAAVLTYTRQAWGNRAGEVKVAEIAAVRGLLRERNTFFTEPELREFALRTPSLAGPLPEVFSTFIPKDCCLQPSRRSLLRQIR